MRLIYAGREDKGRTNGSGIEAETYGYGGANGHNGHRIMNGYISHIETQMRKEMDIG